MSWNFYPPITNMKSVDARLTLQEMKYVPQTIKDYVVSGIDGLVSIYGEDVTVTVSGFGHLCTGKDFGVTSATLEVRKGA